MKGWFSKNKEDASSKQETGAPSSHPDDAHLLDPAPVLRVSREMTEGQKLAASINARVAEQGASSRDVPGSRPGAPAREEAAALYSAGRSSDAARVLTNYMQASKGQVDKTLWHMLFDLYQSTDQHVAFERLALLYAKAFHASPPAWENWSSAEMSMLGRNVLVVEGYPSGMNQEKVADFTLASRQAKSSRLDLSRTRLETEDASASIDRLRDIMMKLRRYRVKTLLMGETRLAEELREVISSRPPTEAKAAWRLLFEILQWRGDEQVFEDLAFEYAMKFEESAPGFELDGVIAVNPDDDHDSSPADATSVLLVVPERLDENNSEAFLADLDQRLRLFGGARLDFSHVRLVSFAAATTFASFLSALDVSPGRVVAVKPTELTVAILEISGALGYLAVETRRR